MAIKRALTMVLGVIVASFIAQKLVWYMNPPFRLYKVAYDFDYTSTNYTQFLILFLIPSISALFLYRFEFKVIWGFCNRVARLSQKVFLASVENKERVLITAVILFWVFNLMEHSFFKNLVESENSFHSPFDPYHEGEKIGFLYTFLSNNEALKEMLIMHGYITEVLTPYLAYLVAPENYAVMGFRLLHTLQTLLAWLGIIWVIWEIVRFTDKKENKLFSILQFVLFSVVFVASDQSFVALNYQHGFIFLQLGLVFYFLRKLTSSPSFKFILITSFLIGISIPLGILYSTKYGLIFGVVFFVTTALLFFHEKFKLFLLGSLLGLASASAIIFVMLGWGQILELWNMVLYMIEFYPSRFSAPLMSDANEHYLWIPQLVIGILTICGIQLVVGFRQAKNFKIFVRENTHLIVLLSLSVLVLKVGLDLSDKRHFRSMANASLLLLFLSSASWLDRLNEIRGPILEFCKTYKAVCFYMLIFLLFVNTNAKEAFRHVKPYWKYISTTDDSLLSKKGYDYILAVEKMRPEIDNMECFYTLTHEGIWYYYFKKPSCSKYHSFHWAISKESYLEIIDSLRSKKPDVILFSNHYSNNRNIAYHLIPEVYQFVYQNYRPYKLIGNHWFWKRSSRGMEGAQTVELDVILRMANPKYNSSTAFITIDGTLGLKTINKMDGVYITTDDSEVPLAIAVNDESMTRVKSGFLETPWFLDIPMVNVLAETKNFQLWGYFSEKHKRVRIGKSFSLDHSKINITSDYSQ